MSDEEKKLTEAPVEPEAPAKAQEKIDKSTAVAPSQKPKPPVPKLLPPFKVLLHNDDVNDFDHVTLAIVKLTSLSIADADQKAAEAHRTGVSLLLVTHQERAELYCEQFASCFLTVTTEPDG